MSGRKKVVTAIVILVAGVAGILSGDHLWPLAAVASAGTYLLAVEAADSRRWAGWVWVAKDVLFGAYFAIHGAWAACAVASLFIALGLVHQFSTPARAGKGG